MLFCVGSLEMEVKLVTKLASYLPKTRRQTRTMVLLRSASSQGTVDDIVHHMQSKGSNQMEVRSNQMEVANITKRCPGLHQINVANVTERRPRSHQMDLANMSEGCPRSHQMEVANMSEGCPRSHQMEVANITERCPTSYQF